MKYIILIIKGMIIGFGKIIPGVSGSLLAMSLGVYETAIYKIRYFFKNLKENTFYFSFLGIGILISIIFGSKMILYFLNHYYALTMFLFIGLILGIVPNIDKKVNKKDFIYYIVTIITMMFILLILNIKNKHTFFYENNFISNIQVLWIGFLEAFTMITPGISGTALFMILGYYDFIMALFSNLFLFLFQKPIMIFIFFVSLFISIFLVSSMMNFLLSKYEKITYAMILGFGYSSIILLVREILPKIQSPFQILNGILLLMLGLFISKKFE